MAASKIYCICIVLLLIQIIFSEATSSPQESSKDIKNVTPSLTLLNSTITNYLALTHKYVDKIVDLVQQVGNDETVANSDEPNLIKFKQDLSEFIEKYEAVKGTEGIFDLIEDIRNLTESQPDAKLRDKYFNKHVDNEFTKEYAENFDKFINDLKMKFEENKMDLAKPLMSWYEEFSQIKRYEEQLEALDKLRKLDLNI